MFFLSVIRFCFNGFCVRQLDHFWGCEDNWSFKWQVDCVIFSISFMGILGWQFCNYFRLSWSRFVCSFFFDCWFCANKLDKSSRIGVNHEGHLWTTEIFDRLPSLCSYLNGFFLSWARICKTTSLFQSGDDAHFNKYFRFFRSIFSVSNKFTSILLEEFNLKETSNYFHRSHSQSLPRMHSYGILFKFPTDFCYYYKKFSQK